MVLILPPYQPTCPLQPLHPSAHLIDRSCRNLILNSSLPPHDVLLHETQSRRLQGLLHGRPLPSLHPNLLCRLPWYSPRYVVMEPFQHIHRHVRDDPDITPVQQNCLHYFLIEHHPGPHCLPRLHNHPRHHELTPLCLTHILIEGRPVAINLGYGAIQIREGGC